MEKNSLICNCKNWKFKEALLEDTILPEEYRLVSAARNVVVTVDLTDHIRVWKRNLNNHDPVYSQRTRCEFKVARNGKIRCIGMTSEPLRLFIAYDDIVLHYYIANRRDDYLETQRSGAIELSNISEIRAQGSLVILCSPSEVVGYKYEAKTETQSSAWRPQFAFRGNFISHALFGCVAGAPPALRAAASSANHGWPRPAQPATARPASHGQLSSPNKRAAPETGFGEQQERLKK
ncbi:hypothetical protein V502_01536 [Pseudogymnoascus sp. VKM F-4520 (FW-2644)]|nr:hypothetical protein V502_01536 [Pseudogymnoascus sp. VKM F-4520 (FW-2644)]